jgi:hypothetical protein
MSKEQTAIRLLILVLWATTIGHYKGICRFFGNSYLIADAIESTDILLHFSLFELSIPINLLMRIIRTDTVGLSH